MWGRNSRSSSDSTCGSPSKALSRSSNPNRTCSRKGQYACTSVRSQLVAPRNVRSQASTASVARDRSTPATNRRGLSAGNPAMDALCGEPGTTSSGTAVERIRRSATPPRNSRVGPRRPWVPTTRARVPSRLAWSTRTSSAKPESVFQLTVTPCPRRRSVRNVSRRAASCSRSSVSTEPATANSGTMVVGVSVTCTSSSSSPRRLASATARFTATSAGGEKSVAQISFMTTPVPSRFPQTVGQQAPQASPEIPRFAGTGGALACPQGP